MRHDALGAGGRSYPTWILGAASDLSGIELVLVNAEPGNPLSDERYPIPSSSNAESAAFEFLRSRKTRFHKNLVLLLDLCFPGTDLKYQYERVWITNAVLSSAVALCGPVPSDCERYCVKNILLDSWTRCRTLSWSLSAVRRKSGSIWPMFGRLKRLTHFIRRLE